MTEDASCPTCLYVMPDVIGHPFLLSFRASFCHSELAEESLLRSDSHSHCVGADGFWDLFLTPHPQQKQIMRNVSVFRNLLIINEN